MGGEHHGRLLGLDGGNHLLDGGRGERRLGLVAGGGRFQYGFFGRDAAHLENLAPAVAEEAVTDHQAVLASG